MIPITINNRDGDWTEDYAPDGENYYMNHCIRCNKEFFGYKRRFTCKNCFHKTSIISEAELKELQKENK